MSKEKAVAFFALAAIAFIAYRNCFDIFIPGDNYSFLYIFEQHGWSGLVNDLQKGVPYYAAYPIMYFLYRLFGTNPVCWMITALFLHALNSYFVFIISKEFLKTFFKDVKTITAFFPALIFLISPYQTEEVLWTAINFRWLFHAFITLLCVYFLMKYFLNSSRKHTFLIHFLFLAALFSYEFTFITPLIFFSLFLLYRTLNKTNLPLQKFLVQIIFPQLILISAYFLICKITSGHWLWHAGTAGDIVQTSDYSKTLIKYLAKFFLFYRYLPLGEADVAIRQFSTNSMAVAGLSVIILAAFAFFFWKISKTKKEIGFFLSVIFLCFIFSLLPVLPLDSSFTKYIYPDRYGYLPSVFFYIFFVFLVYFLFRKIAIPFLTGYAVLCWILLTQTIPVWNSVNDRCNQLIENYKPLLKFDKVYVLNVPAYYLGVTAFRSALSETVYFKYDKHPIKKMSIISGCYEDFQEGSAIQVKISGKQIEVAGPKKQTPFFSTKGGWAKSYETEEYSVKFDSSGCSYTLEFKNEIPDNSAFIYAVMGEWKILK